MVLSHCHFVSCLLFFFEFCLFVLVMIVNSTLLKNCMGKIFSQGYQSLQDDLVEICILLRQTVTTGVLCVCGCVCVCVCSCMFVRACI